MGRQTPRWCPIWGSSIGITRSSSESIRSSQVLPLRDDPKIQANRPGAVTEMSGVTPSGTVPLSQSGMVTWSAAGWGPVVNLRPVTRMRAMRMPADPPGRRTRIQGVGKRSTSAGHDSRLLLQTAGRPQHGYLVELGVDELVAPGELGDECLLELAAIDLAVELLRDAAGRRGVPVELERPVDGNQH